MFSGGPVDDDAFLLTQTRVKPRAYSMLPEMEKPT
jgi:hypothetical protein